MVMISNEFKLETCVKQGCLLSLPSLHLLHWLDHDRNHQKQTNRNQLDNNQIAEGSRFCWWYSSAITHTPWHARKKQPSLASTTEKIGLKINNTKTKVMKINVKLEEPGTLGCNNNWRSPRFCVSRKQNHYRWGLDGWCPGSNL